MWRGGARADATSRATNDYALQLRHPERAERTPRTVLEQSTMSCKSLNNNNNKSLNNFSEYVSENECFLEVLLRDFLLQFGLPLSFGSPIW